MASVPTPFESYAALPYQFPLMEAFPVVRIPIAGPEPFNTLVLVRSIAPLAQYRSSNNELRRFSFVVGTGFKLIGFDPRVPPPFEHSTTGAINMFQTSDDSQFVVALDEATGFFDQQGNWLISGKAADLWDEVYAAATAHLSSWVMCYEPPPPPNLPKGGRTIDWKAFISMETLEKVRSRIGLARAKRRGREPAPVLEPPPAAGAVPPGDEDCN